MPRLAVIVLLLAGCSSAPNDEPAPSSDDSAPRIGRGGNCLEACEEEPPHKDVTFLTTTLTYQGPGPLAVEADVPANITHVSFLIQAGTFRGHDSLSVVLDGCGTYSEPGYGSFGGGSTAGLICSGAAQPGRQAVTLTGTVLLFVDAPFSLTGWQPLDAGEPA